MKHNKLALRLATFAMAMVMGAGLLAPATVSAAADSSVSGRSDFIWGVNGHNRGYNCYPEKYLEQQIRLSAELGVKMYRFNYNPSTLGDLQYLDKVVALANAYGMELMLVMDSGGGSDEAITARFEMVASRYDGKKGHGHIRYIQVFNEVDVSLMQEVHPNGGEGNGSTASDYSVASLKSWQKKFQAAINGLKAGCSTTKSVINFSYWHTYMLEYFKNNGLKWDIIGLDWYSNMGDIDGILNSLTSKFSHDIIICETNYWPEKGNDLYNTNTTYLPSVMKQAYRNKRVKGLIIYELLDEMAFETNGFNGEAHFGLVHCDKEGNIGAVKPAYNVVQKLLGGGKVTPKPTNGATTKATTTTNKPGSTTGATTAAKPGSSQSTALTTSTSSDEEQPDRSDTSSSQDPTEESPDSTTGTTENSAQQSNMDDSASAKPVWPYVAIPAGLVAIGAGVFCLLKFKFGMFRKK